MSIETANAARFKKGMTALTPLEGELLEALEVSLAVLKAIDFPELSAMLKDGINVGDVCASNRKAIAHAHGESS